MVVGYPIARRAARIERSVHYSGCKVASAAGAAPIRRGEPGYRQEMDGDFDGVACEPYR
ncbi:excalibur calcium-binding domain-containing protein [Sphingomonas tagetis]|uniref:excalibur calcium-binding domain-containing protein n=1 Tax=Sphingomonas tagetis TaxID=2949092 RepID=UPI00265F9319|nr:excalibur calcium-binding domain-containing protein [Sphingomonas tagetis]